VSVRLAVFASGGGSNLQAILDHFRSRGEAAAHVALVISDRDAAGALARARGARVAARVIAVRQRSEDAVAADTPAALDAGRIDVVALAGYLRRIPPAVVAAYRGRIVNIHPALLPAFGGEGMYGMRVHRAVLDAGCTVSGATVHHVDEEYDRGRIIAQWPVPVLPDDDPEQLAARVLAVEHRLYPAVLERLAHSGAAGEPDSRREPAVLREAHFGLVAGGAPSGRLIQSLIREREA
jgi:phosphoribosylglycinamide formyltransferase 1